MSIVKRQRSIPEFETAPASRDARADALFVAGRYHEAIAAYSRNENVATTDANARECLGWSYFNLGDPATAERWFRQAISMSADATSARIGLGRALQAQQRFAPALHEFEHVIAARPSHGDALLGAGTCRLAMGEVDAAESLIRAATAANGGGTDVWVQLGIVLDRQGRTDEALAAFEAAWRNEQSGLGTGDTFVNLAIALREANRVAEALALFERNLPHAPNPYGTFVYAMALLDVGRLPEGWSAYEFRWMTDHFLARRPKFRQPAWNGQDLRGKTILLRAEQGLGDTIQFARYARQLRALGARVVLKVHDGFESFARGFADVDRVLDFGEAPAGFDYYAHLMSLPRIFGTDIGTIPAHIPYVGLDSERVARWSARIGTDARLRVGLVWAGGAAHHRDRFRSLSLGQLAPLSEVASVRWFGLQKGPRENDALRPPSGWALDNLGGELADFSDTAAAIAALDLVICVDTAVAHLAGALGKPVWLLLATPADFRWMEVREDSPWYPTMRLFRQPVPGAWNDVIAQVANALRATVLTGPPVRFDAPLPGTPARVPVASLPRNVPGHRHGFSAVAETRYGILQCLPDQGDEGAALGYYGEWLQMQLEWWERWLRPGMTVLEVGASVGAHAIWTSRVLGADGHLLLYERDPLCRRLLRQNLCANRVRNATVIQETTMRVDDLRLELLDSLKVGLWEDALEVLAGAEQTLWELRPTLCLSVMDDDKLRRVAELVRARGYRCGWQATALFNPANFNGRTADLTDDRKIVTALAIPEEAEAERAFEGGTELP